MWHTAMAPYAGLAHALAGRADESLRLLDVVVRLLDDHRSMEYVWVSTSLGEAYLRAGHPRHAVPFVTRALDLARSGREQGRKAHALYLAAEIASRHGMPGADDPAEEYGQALALAGQLGMRPLAARCHLGLGRLYRLRGDHARAGEHLPTAIAMFREMDMRFWLEKAVEAGPHRRA